MLRTLLYLRKKYDEAMSDHSHKKRKDSLETRAELAVLRAYVENEAILEPILFYRASTKQTNQRAGQRGHIFSFL